MRISVEFQASEIPVLQNQLVDFNNLSYYNVTWKSGC